MTVSIVTVSFNQARFLPEAIASIQDQKGAKVEHVIVDPGSTDGSREIASAMANESTKLLFQPDDGPADGLNAGFAETSGDILGYINSDDRLEPGAAQFVERWFAQHPDVDVLSGANRIINEDGSTRWRLRAPVPFSAELSVAGLTTVVQQSTFIRRRAYDRTAGFDTRNRTTWDLELMVDLDLNGARFATVHRALAGFRYHGSTITHRLGNPASEADQELQNAADADMARIRSKIEAAGRLPTSSPGRIRSAAFVARPWNRVLEVTHAGHYWDGMSGGSSDL